MPDHEHYVEDAQELADTIGRWIEDAQSGIERLAAETGKRQERMIGMEDAETDRVLLRVHLACEPGQFASRTMEGELAEVAAMALGVR
jgi:hypothetical protein